MMDEVVFVTPCEGLGDGEAIQAAVDFAAGRDLRTVVIPDTKIWNLEKTVYLPDRITLILEGAQIQSRGVAFENANARQEAALGNEQEEIHLLGRKGACVKGSVAPQIHLKNVKDYSVAGICFSGGEGLRLSHCRYGKVQKLKFFQSRFGVLLTEGCNNNLIEDLWAETEEESVLWLGGKTGVWGRSAELYDTILSRVEAKTKGAPAVALRTAVRAANFFLTHVTDHTEGEGVSVELRGEGEELADLTLRGIRASRCCARVDENCDGVFLANLQGDAPQIDSRATRVMVSKEREAVEKPRFPQEEFETVCANDPRFLGSTDGETLQNALNAAKGKSLLIPRYNARSGKTLWEIEKTLRIPSNTTVILLDAHLRLKDFTYCNLFTNEEKAAENLRILGVGSATLDSGAFNGLQEKNAGQLGFGPITDNALLLFANIKGLVVEHLRIVQNRWYGIFCVGCEKARLSDLDFVAPPIFPDLGGIRIHSGCREMTVENVTGITGEDTVLLSPSREDDRLFAPSCPDVSQIYIRNVKTNASRAFMVKLTTRDGRKIHRVHMENLLDCSLAEQKKLPAGCVLVGDTESEGISELVIRDLAGRGEGTVQMGGESERVELRNLHSFGSAAYAVSSLSLPEGEDYKLAGISSEISEWGREKRAKILDWKIRFVFFRCLQGSRYMRGTATSIITDRRKFVGRVLNFKNMEGERVEVEHVLAERIGEGIFVSGKTSLSVQNFHAAEIGREKAVCGSRCGLIVNGEAVPVRERVPF